MRIRFIHTFLYPDTSAVSQLMSDVAFHMASLGHQVEGVATRGNYTGGERKLPSRENVRGVEFRRVWSPNLGKESFGARFVDLTTFALGGAVQALCSARADRVIILTNPPMYAALGLLLKLFRRERYIYVLMDLYPDIAIRAGLLKERCVFTRLIAWLTRLTLRNAEKIVVLGTCMAEKVAAYGIERSKITIIRNWSDGQAIRPLPHPENPLRTELNLGNRFVLMYSGNMGIGHRFDDLLQVALNLREREDICFLFVGGGLRRKEVDAFRHENELGSILLRDYFPHDRLPYSLPLGDAHFVSLREGYEGLIVPSKTYGIMAAGRPVIYQGSADGEIARMLATQGGGEVVAERDTDALQRIILRWADDRDEVRRVGEHARAVFDAGYTEQTGLLAYQRVIEGRPC